MIKKTIIIGLLLFGFLIATTTSVYAFDDEVTISDPEDDVYDYTMGEDEFTDQKPNIDIISLTYTKTGRLINIDLEVKGVIEDRGDLEDESSFDAVLYALVLTTSDGQDEKEYEIYYINKKCTLNEKEQGITCNVDGSILSLSFRLNDDEESIYGLIATASDLSLLNEDFFMDELTNIRIIAYTNEEFNGEPGKTIKLSGGAIGGTEPYTYSWDFGDGKQSDELSGTSFDELNAEHTYDKEGKYEAILTVTDSLGNVTTSTTLVTISSANDGNDDPENSFVIFISLIVIIVVIGLAVTIYVIRK